MNLTIHPRPLRGTVRAIPSKSQAHRYLICAALSGNETHLTCPEAGSDVAATAECLNALGAKLISTADGYHITPIRQIPTSAVLNCRESGSTLRFLLPIVGTLGVDAVFHMEGRLPERPLSPLWEEMERMGCSLSRPGRNTIRCSGKLRPGSYTMDGGVSSQFITGYQLGNYRNSGVPTLYHYDQSRYGSVQRSGLPQPRKPFRGGRLEQHRLLAGSQCSRQRSPRNRSEPGLRPG